MVSQLQIKNYSVSLQDKKLLNNINLNIASGSVHALMGPNGSGKSTMALSLMGHPAYTVTGSVFLGEQEVSAMPTHKRAQAGLFLSFQQPHEIPGVPLSSFLKAAYEAVHEPIDPKTLQHTVSAYLELLELDQSFYYRNLHEGFSGGEKKKLELLQLLLLKPKFALLDEIDSGLDVDALRVVAQALRIAREKNPQMSILLITHYQRILTYIQPDQVHLLMNGRLVQSGDHTLASTIEQNGYDKVTACQ